MDTLSVLDPVLLLGALLGVACAYLGYRYQALRISSAKQEARFSQLEGQLADRDSAIATKSEALQSAEEQVADSAVQIVRLEADLRNERGRLEEQKSKVRALEHTSTMVAEQLSEGKVRIASLETELAQERSKFQEIEEVSRRIGQKVSADWFKEISKPIQGKIEDFSTKLAETSKSSDEKLGTLTTQLKEWKSESKTILQTTEELTRALSGSYSQKVQGDWGESTLEIILENTGFEKGVHYRAQPVWEGEDGQKLRPDFVVQLPENRLVVIDSKVSVSAWKDVLEATEPSVRDERAKQVIDNIRNHVRDLEARSYHKFAPKQHQVLETTIMYVPVEPALHFALSLAPDLLVDAQKKGVTVVGATLLLPLLRTLQIYWEAHHQQKNQLEIVKQGEGILRKINSFATSFEKAERGVDSAKDAMEAARKQLTHGRGNLLDKANKLRELGISVEPKGQMWDEVESRETATATEQPPDNLLASQRATEQSD